MENKKIGYMIVGLLALIATFLGLMFLGGDRTALGGETGLNTLCTTEFDINTGTTGKVCESWARGSIGADSTSSTTDQFVWTADQTKNIEVTYVAMKPRAGINATKIVWVATTTRQGWPDYETPREMTSSIYRFIIASTTIATSTNPTIDNFMTFLQHMGSSTMNTLGGQFLSAFNPVTGFPFNGSTTQSWGLPPTVATSTSFTMRPGDVLNFVRQNPHPGSGNSQGHCISPCVEATSTSNTIIDWELRYRYRE